MSTPDGAAGEADGTAETVERGIDWRRVLVYGLLPGLTLILAMTAGFMKWQDSSVRTSEFVAAESVQVARDSTVALLTYKPDTVEHDLTAARDRTTGAFRDSYTDLIERVVIPGARQQQISATVTIPAATSVSAEPNHAVVLVFVNQAVTVGKERPTSSQSSMKVTMDRVGDRWLVSGFDAV